MEKLLAPEILMFFVQIIALIFFAKLLGEGMKKLGLPAVIGEIGAGIILGPTILGTTLPDVWRALWIAPAGSSVALDGLVLVSALFLLFVVGLEIDLATIKRERRVVLWGSLFGILIPAAIGYLTGWFAYALAGELDISRPLFASFIGAALSISALPVIAKILLDLDLLRSKVGALIIAVAAVNDIVGWLLFTLVLSTSGHAEGHFGVGAAVMATLVIAVSALTWLRGTLEAALTGIRRMFGNDNSVFAATIILMLVASLATEYIGIHAVFGAFLLGVALADSKVFTRDMRHAIELFTGNIFAPLFFAAVGLKVNFFSSFDLALVLVIFAAAVAGKLFAGWLAGRMSGLPHNESLALGFGINARGGMGIILSLIALNAGLINGIVFEALIITALATSVMAIRVSPLLRRNGGSGA